MVLEEIFGLSESGDLLVLFEEDLLQRLDLLAGAVVEHLLTDLLHVDLDVIDLALQPLVLAL